MNARPDIPPSAFAIRSEEDRLAREMEELERSEPHWDRESRMIAARALLAKGAPRATIAMVYGEEIAEGLEASAPVAPRVSVPAAAPVAPDAWGWKLNPAVGLVVPRVERPFDLSQLPQHCNLIFTAEASLGNITACAGKRVIPVEGGGLDPAMFCKYALDRYAGEFEMLAFAADASHAAPLLQSWVAPRDGIQFAYYAGPDWTDRMVNWTARRLWPGQAANLGAVRTSYACLTPAAFAMPAAVWRDLNPTTQDWIYIWDLLLNAEKANLPVVGVQIPFVAGMRPHKSVRNAASVLRKLMMFRLSHL